MSSYRSQQLLENYGLLQFINHNFLPENVDTMNTSDFQILAQILDTQISWEFAQRHFNTSMALLDTVRVLSKNKQQYVDWTIADLSQLYLYNLTSSIQREPEFVTEMVTELRQNILIMQLDQATLKNYIQRIIENFPPHANFSADGFTQDILQLLDKNNVSFSAR